MLPPQLRAGSVPSLKRTSVTSTRAIALAAPAQLRGAATSTTISQQKRSYFWRGRHCWNSHLDPEFHEYQRKRHQRVRAALRDALRRRTKWQMPLAFSKVLGTRAASHWSRSNLKKWPQLEEELRKKGKSEDDYELSPGEKRWQKQMEAMKASIESNPYRAVFGKPFDPFWSPSMWSPLIPSWAKGETGSAEVSQDTHTVSSTSASDQGQSTSKAMTKDEKQQTPDPRRPVVPYSESSTFTYSSRKEPGRPEVTRATSSTWDSASNETRRSQYDPVSGRMISTKARSSPSERLNEPSAGASTNATPKPNKTVDSAADIPVKKFSAASPNQLSQKAPLPRSLEKGSSTAAKLSILPEHDADFLTADTIRASMGKTRKNPQDRTDVSTPDRQALNKDFDSRMKKITSQIEDARQKLAESKVRSSLQSIQSQNEKILQPALDRMSGSKTDRKSRIQGALAVLDGYSTKPMGMQTSFKNEQQACSEGKQTSLAEEVSDRSTEGLVTLDGYSQEPMGLQKTYEDELRDVASHSRPDLANEIAHKTEEGIQVSDGYTQKPVGLQNTYARERAMVTRQKGPDLAEEIARKTENLDVVDGYSKEPIGLQNTYAKEREAVARREQPELAQEIVNKVNEIVEVSDGYTREPIGLQNTYAKERQAVNNKHRPALADEILSKPTEGTEINDGYTTKPIGLQRNYANERKAVAANSRPDIAQEIANKASENTETSDGYSTEPIGLQSNYQNERQAVASHIRPDIAEEIASKAFEDAETPDGYTKDPIGLQSTYAKERQAVAKGDRLDIAEEIANKTTEDNDTPDGYTKEPMGLQRAYANERQAVAKGDRPALADEIEQNAELIAKAERGLAGQHEDGYTDKPIGLQTCYQQEREACEKGGRPSLEEELKAMNDSAKSSKSQHAELPQGLAFLSGLASNWNGGRTSINPTQVQRQAAAREMLDSEVEAQKHAMRMYDARHAHGSSRSQQSSTQSNSVGLESVSEAIKGEGDMDLNVTKFANRDNWYKQSNSLRAASQPGDELVAEVVRICKENGLLQHSDYDNVQKALKDKVKSLEDRVADQDQKLSRSDQKQQELKMENGNLEAQVRQHMKQQSKLLRTRQELSNENKSLATQLEDQKHSSVSDLTSSPAFEWADPPAYKILAYDPNNSWSSDSMQIVSTTARFSDNETPISVSQALSNLSEPTRFVSHFAILQKEGYQAIHASGHLLVLRKIKLPAQASAIGEECTQKSAASKSPVNPVDGTARYMPTETATGNYASPTGFVNHDPVFPIEKPTETESNTSSQIDKTTVEDGVYYRHYPRVRRQEAVFSGAGRYRDEERHRSRSHRSRSRRAAWKRRVKFAFSVGATSAVLVYALGVGAELAKGEKERQRMEGK
ncbi:Iron transport multicopper oxidase [Elsinoe australis]|uniref:Iron transport multicopper oxidase n=1 Tax=Elsinoe australis TaxID=40998 RepID=A0A2P7YDB5_9PEZI|nr:Iron transport multicopper oxidase [Elsinoe australis]